MGKTFESIRRGLIEATEHARGRQAGVKVYQPVAVDAAGRLHLHPLCSSTLEPDAGVKAGTGNAHRMLNPTTELVVCVEVGERTPCAQARSSSQAQ